MRGRPFLSSVLLVLGLLPLVVLTCVAETVEKLPPPTSYVSDFAGVIDAASKQSMEQLCAEVDHQAHAQIAVVTIRTLEGETKEDFANKLEEKWKVGKKGTDKGVLMLFAVAERQYWIEVGYGLEGALNDAKVGDIGRSMRPQLKTGEYGPAIYGGLRQIAEVAAADAGVTLTTPAPRTRQARTEQEHSGSNAGTIIKIIFFVLILLFIFGRRGGRGGYRGGGGGGVLPWFLLGNLLGGSRRGGGYDGGGGFGGDGGGGSSGGGDDGGFGGFGGGSSGGGGAGGDW